MDIVGCAGIAAEVELLSAVTLFFTNIGITSKDVGIKVNSRKVMASVLKAMGEVHTTGGGSGHSVVTFYHNIHVPPYYKYMKVGHSQ